jgi:5'-3' exonuclease
MGVPGFFAWLLKNNVHNNIIINNLNNIDCLYFDANCLFHPKCFDILKLHSNITDVDKLEKLMIERIIKYITFIIDFVKPSELIYIAVDGVAPVAKINQQRKRRYKSVLDNEYMKKLNKKYNKNKNDSWSNIVITPGTNFMIKLDRELIKFKNNDRFKNIKFIYSSYLECGEGEHKIIRHIKQNNNNIKKIHTIYGLDADLIFLAMSAYSDINNIFLLREYDHVKNVNKQLTEEVNERLCYLSIKNVIDTYNEYIINKLRENEDILDIDFDKKYDFSKDFIIICFMLGNDFIPTPPSINIRNYGIEYITNAYCNMFQFYKSYIYDSGKINLDLLLMIFEYLKDREHDYFTEDMPRYKQKNKNKKYVGSDPYEEEIFNRDNLRNIIIEDHINLGNGEISDYKFRYYEINFNSRINQNKMINKICKNYIDMIHWIMKYYFDVDMPSWTYYYEFNHAPFISDIYKYLQKNKDNYNFDISYKECINIETQLISIIPPQYSNIFNKNIIDKYKQNNNNFKTKFMLPDNIVLEYDKELYWMCEPKLPMLDLDIIL